MSKFANVPKFREEPYPFTDDQRLFIDELRKTEKKQGRGWLRYQNTYCCLGIASELFGAEIEKSVERARGDVFRIGGAYDARFLPMPLVYRLGMRGRSGDFASPIRIDGTEYCALTGLNDQSLLGEENADGKHAITQAFTFSDIADYIEHDPWNVFLGPGEVREDGIALS